MRREQLAAGLSNQDASTIAKLACCTFLPKLSSRDEVSDHIACVAHAMAVGILPGAEDTRLLLSTQIAYTALPSPARR